MLKRQPRPGFTLIELLVVVVIIGILATIGVGGFNSAMDRARNGGVTSNVRSILLGVEQWKSDHPGLPVELTGADHTVAVAYNADSAPSDAAFPTKYVPGGRLPSGPWSRPCQIAMDSRAPFNASSSNTDPNTSKQPDAGGASAILREGGTLDLVAEGVHKGAFYDGGQNFRGAPPPPGAAPTKREEYGYVYYVGDKDTGRFAVLGVGKIGKSPIVTAIRTNFQ